MTGVMTGVIKRWMTGVIKRWVRAGQFPLPLVLPDGERKWRVEEVEQWIFDRPRAKVEDFTVAVKGKKTQGQSRRTE